MYSWPLNINNFTFLDKLKICKFFLENNRWTQDKYVAEYEQAMKSFVGSENAVFVSSGSTANTILAMYLKDTILKENPEKSIVVFPSTTWLTSVSVFIREGFHPKFIDITLKDFSMNLNDLEDFLQSEKHTVAAVFITSLLGYVPDLQRLKKIENKYKVKIMLDNCESTFSRFSLGNISSYFTSTTSTYFGHNTTSGTGEGGFIFTNDAEEYEYFLMARNHGMTRSLPNPEKYRNKQVDARFDFAFLGNNFRNTEVSAFGGLLDLRRFSKYIVNREFLYNCFHNSLDKEKYYLPSNLRENCIDIPFSLPIITTGKNKLSRVKLAMKLCDKLGIETRPIIGQNLLRQTAFQSYGRAKDFPVSEYLHNYGFYVGLYPSLQKSKILNLAELLNNLT